MSLLRLVADDLRRDRGRLALAGLAAVLGSAVFAFLLALASGARAVVLGEILPLDRLEVTPRRVNLDLLALRVGLGSETLDERAVARLAALPGVRRVYPKQVLSVPAVVSGGAGLLGSDIAIEVVADGIEPVLLEAGLRSIDERLAQAAATMGASRWYVIRRVTLPMLGPQLVAGAVLAWARALGEFGATITFAGNLPGRTQTVPLAVFQLLQTDPEGAVALSLLLVAVALFVIVALRARFLSTS